MTTTLPDIGDVFLGRFQLLSIVGYGGYGRIYEAYQVDLDRTVAVKVVAPPQQHEGRELATFVARFKREAEAISRLSDPNTIRMYEHGEFDGLLFMVLEFIDGRSLQEEIAENGAMAAYRVVSIVDQVLQSLGEAHRKGVLHRDIKPGNIMIYSEDGRDRVKVLDFGLAKSLRGDQELSEENLTADDILIGTPRYMSPEQVRGYELEPTSDIYSLGLTGIELLSGRQVIPDQSAMAVVARHIAAAEFDLSHVPGPPALVEILAKMVRKRPEERFQSVEEARLALEAWADPTEDERKAPLALVGLGVVAVLILAGVAFLVFSPGEDADTAIVPPARDASIAAADDAGTAPAVTFEFDAAAPNEAFDPALLEAVVTARAELGAAYRLSAEDAADAAEQQKNRETRRNRNRKNKNNKTTGRNLRIFEP